MLETYFDTTSLSSTQLAERACPVRGCTTALRPQGTRRGSLCPDHGIYVHAETFVYDRPRRNIRFEPDYFEAHIRKNPLKAETHRLGHENSEDALTWNVFACLARNRRLGALSDLSGVGMDAEPELYLWGLRTDLESAAAPRLFQSLDSARDTFERGIHKMNTEPDVMLYVPGQVLMLIEAKFTSDNTVAKDAQDKAGEKPRSASGILRRYSTDELPRGSLASPTNAAPFFSQLYRNLVFAIWMANELKIEWRLVNLVSRRQAQLHQHPDPTSFVHSVLPEAPQHRFRRLTWEEMHARHIDGVVGLDALDTYMRFKSANCAPAFDI